MLIYIHNICDGPLHIESNYVDLLYIVCIHILDADEIEEQREEAGNGGSICNLVGGYGRTKNSPTEYKLKVRLQSEMAILTKNDHIKRLGGWIQ